MSVYEFCQLYKFSGLFVTYSRAWSLWCVWWWMSQCVRCLSYLCVYIPGSEGCDGFVGVSQVVRFLICLGVSSSKWHIQTLYKHTFQAFRALTCLSVYVLDFRTIFLGVLPNTRGLWTIRRFMQDLKSLISLWIYFPGFWTLSVCGCIYEVSAPRLVVYMRRELLG